MTLKEAYDKARKGQAIIRKIWIYKDVGIRPLEINSLECPKITWGDIGADDWEICVEKKKVVIERVNLHGLIFGKVSFKYDCDGHLDPFVSMRQDIKMKMTLEWEE